jgi:hypothetical protein
MNAVGWRIRASAGSAVISLALAACRIFVDTGGLDDRVGAAPDAADLDVKNPVEAGPQLDARVDGPPADVGRPFCANRDASFCDDFDQDALGAKWSTMTTYAGGAVALEPSSFASAPNSVRATVPGDPSGSTRYATLRQDLPPLSALRCELDVRIEEESSDGNQVLEIFYADMKRPNGDTCSIWLSVNSQMTVMSTGGSLPDGGYDGQQTQVGALPQHQWTHLTIEDDCNQMRLFVEGTQVVQKPTVSSVVTDPNFGVGITWTRQDQPGKVLVDNVVCDYTP